MRYTCVRCLALAFLGLLCSSCSRADRAAVIPIQTRIVFDGKPIAGAFVVLHPVGRGGIRPHGHTAADGSIRFTTYRHDDGAPVGDYAVSVEWRPPKKLANGEYEPGQNSLPPHYAHPDTSRLRARVVEGQAELPTLELHR